MVDNLPIPQLVNAGIFGPSALIISRSVDPQGKISSEVMLVRLAEDKFYVVSYPEQDATSGCWEEYVLLWC